MIIDGHVHITNRIYWEGLDPWLAQPVGFDFASAHAAGVRVIIENVAPYGFANYNDTPKQTLRLIETLHRCVEANSDRMGLALNAQDARRLAGEDKLAVFLGVEAGFDHEGDLDVLRALHRLGLRSVQFATQTCFNAFADSEVGDPRWNGINDRGRELVAAMNELGILIDLAHATPQTQRQILEVSEAPVVVSHTAMAAVSSPDAPAPGLMDDDILALLANGGGMVGIIATASSISPRYRAWMSTDRASSDIRMQATQRVVTIPTAFRPPLDHGEYSLQRDARAQADHLATATIAAEPAPSTVPDGPAPTAQEWAAHVRHVIDTVGADHVGIGLDLAVGHDLSMPPNAAGYGQLLEAVAEFADAPTVEKVAAANWLRVLDAVL